ncbi:MAG TPA: sensor histidine kinase KdpD, partial [Candidatus Eisenbacteria bacterium]
LVDELAHTNVPGSRHAKRWQDVEELLHADISVYTTLNVQHVDSLNDTVELITGTRVRETLPDSILDRADEIELVDLPPDDLLQRLREGKVYVPEQAGRALEHFFQKGNLIALRELALRYAAQRVDAQMESYRRVHAIRETWPVGGRLLVCLGGPDTALHLVRAGRGMAAQLRADWIVLHVERPGRERLTEEQRSYLANVMYFAEELGADLEFRTGHSIVEEILAFARERNVSRIVVGKPSRARWMETLLGSLVSSLIRLSGDIDVYVIRGEPGAEARGPRPEVAAEPPRLWAYGRALAVVVACTLIATLMRSAFGEANLIMVYLLGVMAVAIRLGRGPASAASILSVAAFDFFFVPPSLTLGVSDTQYLVTFAVMLAAALTISTLAVRLREQAEAARHRERRTHVLYRLSRTLAATEGEERLLDAAVRSTAELFESRVAILLPDSDGTLVVRAGDRELFGGMEHDRGVAQWVFDRRQPAGAGTDTLPAARGLYLPLEGAEGAVGVLGLRPAGSQRVIRPDQFRLLETFASQIALALERALLARQAERSRVQIESERLQNALLSSVSHDFRTPLAVITGAASSLLDPGARLGEEARRTLIETVGEEAQRLNRLVANLLEMTRLESGALSPNLDWHSLEEVIGASLEALEDRLRDRTLIVDVPRDLPLVRVDDVLLEQVLLNLVENALKYTPRDKPIEIRARAGADEVRVEVADRGPGLPPGEEKQIFEKFYRVAGSGSPRGVGLGLTICRGIIEAHHGGIGVENREGGGACFFFTLPLEAPPPNVQPEPQ